MAFDGSGTFLRIFDWTDDAAAGVKIRADRHDAEMDDYAGGLSNCLTRDGQSQPTADIPMNGFRITDLGAPTELTDAANKLYVDNMNHFTDGLEVIGPVEFYDGAILRGKIEAQIGAANAAAMFSTIYDDAGVEKNKLTLKIAGLHFDAGDLLFYHGTNIRSAFRGVHDGSAARASMEARDDAGVLSSLVTCGPSFIGAWSSNGSVRFGRKDEIMRGLISAEVVSNNGLIEVRAVNNDGSTAGNIKIDATGINSTGEFFQQTSGNNRIRVGFIDGKAQIKALDSAGALMNSLAIENLGANLYSKNGNNGYFRVYNDSASPSPVLRGIVGFASDGPDAASGFIACYDNNGVRQQRITLDAAGARLLDGGTNIAGDILTTGNVVYKGTNTSSDLPIGSTVLFTYTAGSEMARNGAVALRLENANNREYTTKSGGALMGGNWSSSGLILANNFGMAKRIS